MSSTGQIAEPVSADPASKWEDRAVTQAYRCYLLDLGNRIAAVKVIECRDDRAAKRKGKKILAACGIYSGAEIWDRGRRVHAIVPNALRPKAPAKSA